ncbi:ABC transporter permease [Pelagibius sp. Alg239-R121]|uniref:ABC transporter permease n=1 Tax=Pelagibius sp. Alg239-R121 TaxID=2993448 RepID=UPI0024A6CC5F|nr:ABC transporter permease [Pelagibius sp. Alg239-R121]
MDFIFDLSQLTDFLATTLRLSIPIIFAAVGGVISEKAGVFNISLEGCILGGAFGAAVGAFYTGSPFGGLIVAMLCAGGAGLILAVLGVSLGINQIVAGIAINILMLGLTSFLARFLFGGEATTMTLVGFHPIAIPGLALIPVLGPVLFNQDLLVYMMYLMVPAAWWILFRTPWGLNIRAIGQYPRAADTAGINVQATRYYAVVASCMLAGLGGAYIVLSQVFVFTEHMSAGKGFIALSALILGRWNPVGALLAALLFGLFDALQLRLQFNSPDVPYQIFSMAPYLASILALVLLSGKVRPPAAIGVKFVRGAK